jgi:3-dehydroquinate synthase
MSDTDDVETVASLRVPVALGERSYDIVIGDGELARVGELFRSVLPKARACVVTDANVAQKHLATLERSFRRADVTASAIVVPAGETTKCFDVFEQVVDQVIAGRYERGDAILALGGGVVGDLAGLVAGVVRRGMRFVQVPTTLLAQVDSSVGGKTGINTAQGKNLVGVFHQPDLVVADTAVLDTLPPREFRAGYAEVVKYGLINDPEFFAWLEANWRDVFAGGVARRQAIATSCRAKATIVARDEWEAGDRALLNLGHTFGHVLETYAGYGGRLVHGEAVAIGMVLAHDFSVRLNLMSRDDAERVRAHLKAVGLPTRFVDVPGGVPDAGAFMEMVGQDKKVQRGALTFILSNGIGKAFIAHDVPFSAVKAFVTDELQRGSVG